MSEFTKDELKEKLTEVKEEYLVKHSDRLQKIKPVWETVQMNVPALGSIQPYIDFCDTGNLQDLWWYGRVITSTAPLSGEVGRRFHYLIRDKETGFVLGIVGLSSDLTIPIRDKHIGWTKENKWTHKKINYLMNVQHCIATPPLNNYLTGKLAALSVKSEEVQVYFEKKYGHKLALYTVTSLYGKSSIYNRLEGFKYLGTTKGYSSVLVPLSVKDKVREEYKKTHGKHSEIYYNEDGTVKDRYGVVKTFQKLGKHAKAQRMENLRGVYVIPLSYNYQEFLCEKDNTLLPLPSKSFGELTNYWETRWFLPRIERLKNK